MTNIENFKQTQKERKEMFHRVGNDKSIYATKLGDLWLNQSKRKDRESHLNETIYTLGGLFFAFWILIVGVHLAPEITRNGQGSLRLFYPLSIILSSAYVLWFGLKKGGML